LSENFVAYIKNNTSGLLETCMMFKSLFTTHITNIIVLLPIFMQI